jgi:hypothetical protein
MFRAGRQVSQIRRALSAAGIDVIGGDAAAAVERALATLRRLREVPAEPALQGDEAAALREEFRRRRCQHCGGAHARACPRVRKFRFHADSKLASVEFWPRGDWSDDGILWPESLPPDPAEDSQDDPPG